MIAILLLLIQESVVPLGGELRSGIDLVDATNGRPQPPSMVDSALTGLMLDGRTGCARILLRRRPAPAQAEESRHCISGDTLFAWSARDSLWRPQRPVGPDMRMSFPRTGGDTVRYHTSQAGEEVISGRRLRVIQTEVFTVDSLGRPKRRLRERYAPGLATATGGRFEVPDASAPGGWRTEQEFELSVIR